jgi:hypothetical protein
MGKKGLRSLLVAPALVTLLSTQQPLPSWDFLSKVNAPLLQPIFATPPTESTIPSRARREELSALAAAEHALLRERRGHTINRFRHMSSSTGRDEFTFYLSSTGEPLLTVPRTPDKPTYMELTAEGPNRELACQLMRLGLPDTLRRRLDRIQKRLEAEHGGGVNYHSGKRSDLDCWTPVTGDLFKTWQDIYFWNEVPRAGHILTESAGNPLAVSPARARGLTQILDLHDLGIASVLLKQGVVYDWRDMFQNAAVGSAIKAVSTKARGSLTIAQADYIAGRHNVNFVLRNGADLSPRGAPLEQYISALEPTLLTWRDRALRSRYGLTFGRESEAYVFRNAANEEIMDSIASSLPQSRIFAYKLNQPLTPAQASERTGVPLETIRRLNNHPLQRSSYLYLDRFVQASGMTEDTWWRRRSEELEQVWLEWNAEQGPWTTARSRDFAARFERAGNPYMAWALRSEFGRTEVLPKVDAYAREPARLAALRRASGSPLNLAR